MISIKKSIFFWLIFFLVFFTHQLIFQSFFPNSEGFLGHDYEYFIPNLIFGNIWFYNNFLSIPWFTPSFCCGIPFYGDPQSVYYSIYQIIFLIFDLNLSVKIIFLTLSFISYVGFFLLARKSFSFNLYTSLLCSSLFLFNGFFIYRAIAGHLAYLSYVFVPLYCFFLIQSTPQNNKKINFLFLILSSVVFAAFFHSGSSPIILIIFTSIICVLLIYYFLFPNLKLLTNFILSVFIGILIALSKITAIFFFLSNFPRKYNLTEFNTFSSFIKTSFLSLFTKPNAEYINDSQTSMFPFGLHEMEYGTSIVPLILILSVFLIKKEVLSLNFSRIKFIFIILFIFLIPIFLNINIFNQFFIIKKIPILNSTWVQIRWMVIYIIPIIIISGLIIENLKFNNFGKMYFSIFLILILLIQNFIRDKSWHINDQKYDLKNAINFSSEIKFKKNHEIKGSAILLDKSGQPKKTNYKNDIFFNYYSPLTCYQPIFGYGLERLNTEKINFNYKHILKDDSYLLYSKKFDEKDGHFSFFNPSCFLFPKENNCLPGDTFKVSEKEKLNQFTSYQKFDFKKNKFQIIANYISIFTLLFCLLYIVYSFIKLILILRRKI